MLMRIRIFENPERLLSLEYRPTEDDVLHAHREGREMSDAKFDLNGRSYSVSEDSPLSCLSPTKVITTVAFVVPFCGYDQYSFITNKV